MLFYVSFIFIIDISSDWAMLFWVIIRIFLGVRDCIPLVMTRARPAYNKVCSSFPSILKRLCSTLVAREGAGFLFTPTDLGFLTTLAQPVVMHTPVPFGCYVQSPNVHKRATNTMVTSTMATNTTHKIRGS